MRHVTVGTDKGASTIERRQHWHHNLSGTRPSYFIWRYKVHIARLVQIFQIASIPLLPKPSAALPTSSSHRGSRCDDDAAMPHRCRVVAGLWTSPAPSQLIFVRIHWLLHSAASIDSTLRAIRCGDIVAAPEEKRRSHSADIAGIDSASSASLARLGHFQVLPRQ
jgi:hypothetical protein